MARRILFLFYFLYIAVSSNYDFGQKIYELKRKIQILGNIYENAAIQDRVLKENLNFLNWYSTVLDFRGALSLKLYFAKKACFAEFQMFRLKQSGIWWIIYLCKLIIFQLKPLEKDAIRKFLLYKFTFGYFVCFRSFEMLLYKYALYKYF